MAAFVLVHGSGQNADSWSRVASLLVARGHAVTAPDLPKHPPDWRLEEYAAEIARSITEPRTVVVAHSLCGVFLPLMPRVEDCALLVFLAAVIPEPGKSIRDQFTEDPGMFHAEWIAAGARWFDRSQQEALAREFLFHDCEEETLPWALRTVEAIDTQQLVTQPAPFTSWPSVPAVSIVSTDDRTLTSDWGRRISSRVLGRAPLEVQAGHCPHMSQPRLIADLLERLCAPA